MQKKINCKTQDNNQNLYKSKSCRAAEFSNFWQVHNGPQKWSCLHRRWLSWWSADWSSWFREPLIHFGSNWVLHRSLFLRRKKELVDWLCHISRVRNLGIVHSHMLRHFLHHLHGSKLVLCDGNLREMMFV